MPSDLTIHPAATTAAAAQPEPPEPPNTKDLPVGAALTAAIPVMPTLTVNPETGIVVIDFRNEAGEIVSSIPTAQQLSAYREATSSPPSPIASDAVPPDAPRPDLPQSHPQGRQGEY
jgi:hypothetical protein